MIAIENHGPMVRASNYWDSPLAERGLYYLSLNAGAFRLLCPPGRGFDIREMRTGKEVIVTRGIVTAIAQPSMEMGREMIEILFDDRTDTPFALFLSLEQCDRAPVSTDAASEWIFSAWEGRRGKSHQVLNRTAYYREAELACLKPITGLS